MEKPMKSKTPLAWTLILLFTLCLLYFSIAYPELLRLRVALLVGLLGSFGFLAFENKKALKGRTAAFGLHSAVTVLLILGIIGVANFLASRYPFKLDLTKNQRHTLSDQSVKLVKGLTVDVKAVVYAVIPQQEQMRPILSKYSGLNPKFQVEYVNPDQEIGRIRQAGIRKSGTVQLLANGKDVKVEDANEEKLTNALIKLLKTTSPLVCTLTGHGERSASATDAEGYSEAKKGLVDQAYEVKEVNLITEANKIPANCSALVILGANRAFFDGELKAISDFLAAGGRAVVALDLDLKGGEPAQQLLSVIEGWYVHATKGLVVDPYIKAKNLDASTPILPTLSAEHPITKDTTRIQAAFPILRPLEALPNPPSELKITWLAQSSPVSFLVTDFKQLATGQVSVEGKKGPFNGAMAVEGKLKDSKATRATRLVVFGSAAFANNHFSRFGSNLDLFLNSVSWTVEDESLISIRTREEDSGKVTYSDHEGGSIFFLTVFFFPILVSATGILIWAKRKRL